MYENSIWEEVGHIFMFFFAFLAILMVFAHLYNNVSGGTFSESFANGIIVPLGLESAVLAIIGVTLYTISWRLSIKEKRTQTQMVS